MAIGRLEKRRAILSRQTGIPQPAIDRRQEATDHRRQVRRELQLNAGSRRTTAELLDLAGVAMADDAIGRDAFRGLREQEMLLRRPSAATGARLGVNDDPAGLDQPLLQEGRQRQQACRRETARGCHQARLGNLLLLPFHQAIDGFLAKSGVLAGELAGL